jgi:2-dehydro-3-deoxyphosphogluconate aldolase/(4S)-4-hydroxy-2-oxoglutarate aldolase
MIARITEYRIVPVAVVDAPEDALPLADALLAAGLPVVEVTLRTPAALEAIRLLRRERPQLLVGAGTVLSPEQVEAAVAAGAEFGLAQTRLPVFIKRLPAKVHRGMHWRVKYGFGRGC